MITILYWIQPCPSICLQDAAFMLLGLEEPLILIICSEYISCNIILWLHLTYFKCKVHLLESEHTSKFFLSIDIKNWKGDTNSTGLRFWVSIFVWPMYDHVLHRCIGASLLKGKRSINLSQVLINGGLILLYVRYCDVYGHWARDRMEQGQSVSCN